MVSVVVGDLFKSKAQTLVNTVNCVGIMGKGIALEFKQRFPEMFKDYAKRCTRGEVRLGRPYIYRSLFPPSVINFPTKDHWRSMARLDDITAGLEYLLEHYESWGVKSIAVPPLGTGNGQLEWRVVGPTLFRYLSRMDIPVELYAPYGTPQAELQPSFLLETVASMPDPTWVPAGAVALVDILSRVEAEPYSWPVGRTIFQKIAFFATESGIPTSLKFVRGSYGPYSADLKRMTSRLLNNGLIREERLGRMIAIEVGPTFPDARIAYALALDPLETAISRVADLAVRLNTGTAEVTASVLLAARELASELGRQPNELEVLADVMAWKQRRRPPLTDVAIASAIRNLAVLGWLDVEASSNLPTDELTVAGLIGAD